VSPEPPTDNRQAGGIPRWLPWLGAALALAGLAAWAPIYGNHATRPHAAAILLVNFLYWTGLAQAGVVWAATLRLCRTRWSHAPERLGEAFVAFLPLALIPFGVLYLCEDYVLPWAGRDMGDRTLWVNPSGIFARNAVGLVVMLWLSVAYVRRRLATNGGTYSRNGNRALESAPTDGDNGDRGTSVLAVLVPLVYTVVYSILAFDFIMGLQQPWYSTLIGGYFFVGNMYAGMAAIVVLASVLGPRLGFGAHLQRQQWLDIGNLLQAFGMLTIYMFFSQLIPIWYGNMPHETSFLLARFHHEPWRTVVWCVIAGAYFGPFLLMCLTEIKRNPVTLRAVAALVLVGMYVERYLLVIPSLEPRGSAFGPSEVLTAVGFGGAFLAAFAWYVLRYGPLWARGEQREAKH
jgi:Ni/Fe-hydrogenase subunit HybB-like protein